MRKLVIKSLLEVNGRDPGGPGLPLQPPQPSLSFPTGRAWQSWRTRCSRTPRCCGKYLLLVPVPFLPLPMTLPHPCRRDAGGMQEAAAHHQSIWSSQPQAPPTPTCALFLQLPACLTTLNSSLLSPHRALLAKMEKLELRDPPALL